MSNRLKAIGLSVAMISLAQSASAATTTFASDPFAGSTALATPGRQVVATNELFLPSFNLASDTFAFEQSFFGVSAPVSFFNGFAASLPLGGLNVIVLNDTDNDANPATAFNAGTAANLIAARIDTAGPGFFVYRNSSLSVNRLVYSVDLSDSAADLSVLARVTSPTGADAIALLDDFTVGNFEIVPAPSALALLALAGVAGIRRRRVS